MIEKKYHDGSEKATLRQAFQYSVRGLKILSEIQPGMMTRACISNALGAVRPVIILYFSSLIISELTGGQDIVKIAVYIAITVGAALLISMVNSIINYVNSARGQDNFWLLLSRWIHCRYAEMDYKYVEDGKVNELLSDIKARWNANGLGLPRLCWMFPNFFGQIIGFVSAGILLSGMFFSGRGNSFFGSPSALALLILASIIIPAAAQALMMERTNKLISSLFTELAKSNTLSSYYLDRYIYNSNSGKDVRIFRLAEPIINAFKRSSSWMDGEWKKAGCEAQGLTAAINTAFMALAYLFIGLRALDGMYDIGEVARYVGAVTAFSGAVVGIINNIGTLHKNAQYLPMMYDFIDLESIKYNGTLTTEKRADNEYDIEFHDVSFKYPGSEAYALKKLNLKLNVGRRIAVVGMNGSGKTTMIKLICRLYEPMEGEILLNGIDIRKYDYNEYMDLLSVVFQDFKLLDLPIGQNIAANAKYDSGAAESTLEKAGFGKRMNDLEKGLESTLNKGYDENGIIISGGEAQKIALARALYKNAPFIVLDEPTAALDPIAEFEIYSKFNEIIGGKTAIFISHRLSSCRFCDDIVVFHEGELIQRGSHESLIADRDGRYYELWNAQAQYYA